MKTGFTNMYLHRSRIQDMYMYIQYCLYSISTHHSHQRTCTCSCHRQNYAHVNEVGSKDHRYKSSRQRPMHVYLCRDVQRRNVPTCGGWVWVWQYLTLACLHETDSVVLSGGSDRLMALKAFRDGTRNDQLSLYCRERGRREGRREKGKGRGRESRVEGKENSAENKRYHPVCTI